MWRRGLIACAAGAVLAACLWTASPASAQEGDAERDADLRREREADERAQRQKLVERAARALQRKKAGKELTEEERDAIGQFQRLRARAKEAAERRAAERERKLRAQEQRFLRQPQPRGPDTDHRRLKHDKRLNAIDAAYYGIAEIYLAKKQYEPAVGALGQLIRKSPDKRAVSLTHLNLAELYRRELGNTRKAIEEYKKVTGEFAIDAQARLAQLFEELDQIDEAVEHFENLGQTAEDKTQKVLALRQLAELLVRNGRSEEAVAALQRLIQSVSYEEAARISKALAEEQARRLRDELEEQQRSRTRMMKAWQQQRQRRRPARKLQIDREFRPVRAPAHGPKQKTDAIPREEPIRPDRDEE